MAMVVVFASCSQDETDSPLNTYTLTGYADVESRTAFGTPGDTKIPFQWSAGDRIYVGNTQSNAITNGGNSATFNFNGTPSGTNVYYNMTGSSNQANVKTTQTVGNLGTNGDFGYGTINNGSFILNHATSYLWFDVTSTRNNVTLQSIKVSADVNIAGKATWSGSSFGAVIGGSNSIELAVNQTLSSTNSNVWAMVVLPNLASKSFKVTYKLKVGNNTKYYSHTVAGKSNYTSGKTQKVSMNITNSTELTDYAELRVLTFEDDDAKFTPYDLDYAGVTITKWSDLIDEPQYGGPLTYGDYMSAMYTWWDENNTELSHTFPDNYAYCFWGGGHAISHYWGAGYTDEDRDTHIAKYYGEDYVTDNAGNDAMLGWFNLQMMTPVKAHSGNNFAVHYGYKDFFSYVENLPELIFADGKKHVIDHMYVTNTNYTLNQLFNGVKSEAGNSFGGNWTGLTDSAWLKIVAYGFDDVDADADAEPISEVEFYLVKGKNVVTDWQKWDLSELGEVAKVRFNFLYSDEMGGKYGFTIPGYFAYDDVAVRF